MKPIVAALLGCLLIVAAMAFVATQGDPLTVWFFIALFLVGFIAAQFVRPDEVIPAQRPFED